MVVKRKCLNCKKTIIASVINNDRESYIRCAICGKKIRIKSIHKKAKGIIVKDVHY